MHLDETHEGDAAREFVTTPLPRGCDWPEVKGLVRKVEVMATSVNDPGDDRYEVIAYDEGGVEIGRKAIQGY